VQKGQTQLKTENAVATDEARRDLQARLKAPTSLAEDLKSTLQQEIQARLKTSSNSFENAVKSLPQPFEPVNQHERAKQPDASKQSESVPLRAERRDFGSQLPNIGDECGALSQSRSLEALGRKVNALEKSREVSMQFHTRV